MVMMVKVVMTGNVGDGAGFSIVMKFSVFAAVLFPTADDDDA